MTITKKNYGNDNDSEKTCEEIKAEVEVYFDMRINK